MSLASFMLTLLVAVSAIAASFSVGEPNVIWLKHKVHVCWRSMNEPTDFTLELKKTVQAIIEQEYIEARTGISFYGWEECDDSDGDLNKVEIYQDNEMLQPNVKLAHFRTFIAEGFSNIGQGSNRTKNDNLIGFFERDRELKVIYLLYRPTLDMNSGLNYGAIDHLKMNALHEFGHTAGLRHEHMRREAQFDENCVGVSFDEKQDDTTVFYEPYDPYSVMNYCWLQTVRDFGKTPQKKLIVLDQTIYDQKNNSIKIGLSAKDVLTLKKLYQKN